MNEEEIVKKQLIKNMVINLITFSVIFYILGIVIYSQFSNSVYKSADLELNQSNRIIENKRPTFKEDVENPRREEDQRNPRLIFIQRNQNGEIIEDNDENQNLNEIFTDISFDKNQLNTIYEIKVENEYTYRGINYQLENGNYTQVLINVDAEKDIAEKFKTTLIIALLISIVLIILASYILSKKTLKPIIEALKRQNQFIQDASHELRTPLTIIKAKQEKLLEKPETKIIENAEDISITLKETQRLTKLINELMELIRKDTKNIEIKKEEFYVDKEIETISNLYKDVANSQNKTLILDLKYEEKISADINKFKELLIILLDNSIKYTEEKDLIKIKTYKKENKFIMEVEDTGIGIGKEAQAHIFERFYREEKSRVREKGGMGLGLAIAYDIVKYHKGTIKIDKNRKDGSKFIIKLPIK